MLHKQSLRLYDLQASIVGEKLWYWLGAWVVDRLARARLEIDLRWHTTLPSGPKIIAPNHPTTIVRFLQLEMAGRLVWIILYGGLGYWAGAQWPVLQQFISRMAGHLGLVAVLAAGTFLLYRRWRVVRNPTRLVLE